MGFGGFEPPSPAPMAPTMSISDARRYPSSVHLVVGSTRASVREPRGMDKMNSQSMESSYSSASAP
jgi:hypothetical protein